MSDYLGHRTARPHPSRRLRAHGNGRRLLRWIFQRGNQRLTCRIDQRPETGFTLSLVPHSPRSIGIAETFTSAWSALQRHAMIATELRGAGWTLAAYTAD
jgi:hypothetical protein